MDFDHRCYSIDIRYLGSPTGSDWFCTTEAGTTTTARIHSITLHPFTVAVVVYSCGSAQWATGNEMQTTFQLTDNLAD